MRMLEYRKKWLSLGACRRRQVNWPGFRFGKLGIGCFSSWLHNYNTFNGKLGNA